ncbi:tetratricopeptide repeat protein [Paractinoplanes atraurantiacus]|uniref:Tetratricopeptide repeat-containing protein n=1 Tax=Paractinoplanes atraurantiacus TaxID=1036182 RepID=A0A285IMI7_9ACTN|nr:tetratricopeptide repeat protein [Actinoplanes atraurantiacus]SNY49188.1 Tetratricopeptide repeat-containing protein [Actinoplanes atraurantiacus]
MSERADAYWRAHRLAQVGRYDEAEKAAREGLALDPGDARLLTLLASVLRLRRDYAGALATADAAVAAAPQFADAHAERAENLIVMIRSRDAVSAAAEAVRLGPTEPTAHFVLARALASAKDYPRARAAAAHGRSLDPNSVEGLLTVADVERDAGNRDAALTAARAALAIAPGNPYGRWLIAMLDAERLRVRRSMRALRDVARDNPARADVVSMTWPIRGVLNGLRRGVAASAALVCLLQLIALWWWPTAGPFGRVMAGVLAAVMAGFAARILIPAGRLPWRCLRLLPPLMRRANVTALALTAVATILLFLYAVTSWWPLPLLALALTPFLWLLGLAELLGAGLDDPGMRHAITDLAAEFRAWWHTTKKDLREAWTNPQPTRKQPSPTAPPSAPPGTPAFPPSAPSGGPPFPPSVPPTSRPFAPPPASDLPPSAPPTSPPGEIGRPDGDWPR